MRKLIAEWTWKDWVRAYVWFYEDTASPFVRPLWFMRDLFVLNLLAPVLKRMIDRAPRLMMLGLLVTIVFSQELRCPLLRQFALISFCVGYYAVKYDWHLSDVDKLSPLLLAGGYLAAIVLDIFARGSRFYFLTDTVNVLLGLLFFTRCTTKIKNSVWKERLMRLSRYGVPVYLFHERTLGIIKKIAAKFLPTTALSNIMQYFGAVFLIILLCVTVAKLMERFTPKLYSVVTGGRTM